MLVEQARGRPLLVFVDDAHLLNNGSAILLHQMALTEVATVLATVHAGEVLPDPVLSLWKDGPAERIEIGVLDDATIEELLASALEGPVGRGRGTSAGRAQSRQSDVLAGAGQRCARDRGPRWRRGASGDLEGALSPTVRLVELVALRLGNLSQSERSALELLALGEPLGPVELSRLTNQAAVDALEEKAWSSAARTAVRVEIRLAHPVYGDVMRAGIGTASRAGPFSITGRGDRSRRHASPARLVESGNANASSAAAAAANCSSRGRRWPEPATATPSPNASPGRPLKTAPGLRPVSLESGGRPFPASPRPGRAKTGCPGCTSNQRWEKSRVALLRFDNIYLERRR